VFETVLRRCIREGLVGGEGFATDASLIKADANRQNGIAGEKGLPSQATGRTIEEYLAVLDDAAFGAATDVTPKFVSPADPAARWTGAHRGQAFFAYSTNYPIDVDNAIIVDVEATTANRQAEVLAAKRMIERAMNRFDLYPARLLGDSADYWAPFFSVPPVTRFSFSSSSSASPPLINSSALEVVLPSGSSLLSGFLSLMMVLPSVMAVSPYEGGVLRSAGSLSYRQCRANECDGNHRLNFQNSEGAAGSGSGVSCTRSEAHQHPEWGSATTAGDAPSGKRRVAALHRPGPLYRLCSNITSKSKDASVAAAGDVHSRSTKGRGERHAHPANERKM
jgi:hypothetical protein